MQLEKQERVRKFKEDVKQRVKNMEKARRQQQLENHYQKVEHENNVVKQSAFCENLTPRKDNCSIRRHGALSINRKSPVKGEEESKLQAFHDQTNEIHRFTNQARRKLGSKKVITDDFIQDDLPGGVWKVSSTRDHPASRSTVDGDTIDIDQGESIVTDYTEEDEVDKENEERTRIKAVHFDLEPSREETRNERINRKSTTQISGSAVRRYPTVPSIYEGVVSEEEKRLQQKQHATYRRLFMDIEREQVKENLRRQEHRKQIQKLKKEKEEERRREEQLSHRLVEPRDPITGESSVEIMAREIEEERQMRETIRQHEEKMKKAREMERFVEALRQQLRERIQIRNIELPPLCCCGETIWDTNPETCANNCVFYKNHRGYAKALQSLLQSSGIE